MTSRSARQAGSSNSSAAATQTRSEAALDLTKRLAKIDLESVDSNDEEHDLLVDFIDEARDILTPRAPGKP